MLNDESRVRFFCMTRAKRALEIVCDNRKQKLYRLNRTLEYKTKRGYSAFPQTK